ncbi:MAG: cytochrome c3 family protein [bacterium]
MNKRRAWRVYTVAGLFIMGILGLSMAGQLMAQPKPPADFTYDQGKESPGKVTFSHEKHSAKNPKCTDCHTKIFKMKRGTTPDFTKANMKQGQNCGSCHNGQVAFGVNDQASCVKCHKK